MVSSVNEWGADQTRILLLTDQALHRVKYNFAKEEVRQFSQFLLWVCSVSFLMWGSAPCRFSVGVCSVSFIIVWSIPYRSFYRGLLYKMWREMHCWCLVHCVRLLCCIRLIRRCDLRVRPWMQSCVDCTAHAAYAMTSCRCPHARLFQTPFSTLKNKIPKR